ncbi:MAG: hypothetical protein SP1CHLAM54_11860 [Chlamydiia bacterium]|nr:hypothetical protein [Chlamydiia bacterium]MCH9616085.1 hypothetical protein [Chlamydiia bacterium]MCH9629492.1 hypothetical protein [Chlamydiia bacterium]
MKKTIKVVPASGIGDGLLMMIVAHHAKKSGHDVIIAPHPVSPLFPEYTFSDEDSDITIIQNDNSGRCWDILKHRGKDIHFFFPKFTKVSTPNDFLFSPYKTMVQNISEATSKLLRIEVNGSNGLTPLPHRSGGEVFIHPSSMNPKKNWRAESFISLANLIKRDYDVTFCVSPGEYPSWEWIKAFGFSLPHFPTLVDLKAAMTRASCLIGNDSGLGHLASNLGIPTLTIGATKSQLRLWRPGWATNSIITPNVPLPNFKGLNMAFRDRYWPDFVSVNTVYKGFQKLCKASQSFVQMD